jgi:hypothetical protein
LTFQRLFDVVVYLLPGFIASATFFFLVATRRRSDLERLALSVVLSFPVRWTLIGADGLLHAAAARWGRALNWSLTDSPDMYVGAAIPCAIAIGIVGAVIVRRAQVSGLVLRVLNIQVRPEARVWNVVFNLGNRLIPMWHGWVQVRIDSGLRFEGYVRQYSVDPNQDRFELFLEPAFVLGLNDELVPVPHGTYLQIGPGTPINFLGDR